MSTVTDLSPNVGSVADSVTITGTGFGASQGASTVSFAGTAVASYTSWSDTSIVVVVPASAASGRVTVTVSGAAQASYYASWFEVIDTTKRGLFDIRAQDQTADSSPEDLRYADGRDFNDLLHLYHNGIPRSLNELRLTLTTAVPVTTADVTAATSIYHTPLSGGGSGRLALPFNATATLWGIVAISEQTIAVGTITADKNYDIFVSVSGSGVAYEAVAWTNNTTRATALVAHGGAWLKTGALNKRYIGTFRTTATTTTEDSAAKRFLWNASNRMPRKMKVAEATNTWAYTTATLRSANNSTVNRLQYVAGLSEEPVTATIGVRAENGSGCEVSVDVGMDSTSAGSADRRGGFLSAAQAIVTCEYAGWPGIGFHFLQWLEYSAAAGTTTWVGDNGGAIENAAIMGSVWA